MKNTKGRIVDIALHLFNTKGLANVTLRTIAQEMGISQGNLNYHFKKREEIIEALYYRLVEEMDTGMTKIEHSTIGLKLIYDISSAVMETSYKYRFFLLDFTQIMRENRTIRNHYQSLVKERQEQIIGLFAMLIERKIMREEKLTLEYLNFYKRLQIFGDFWLSSVAIEKPQVEKKLIAEYLGIIIQSIYPYLTEKGEKEYKLLFF